MSGFLDDRRRSAEEAFFARQNEKLRVQMRTESPGPAGRAELAAASGLRSDALLDGLSALNIGPEGAAALSLMPLVAVAWADGEISPKEREALLAAAKEAGLSETDSGYRLFAGWLDDHPSDTLLARWKDYAEALLDGMSPEAAAAFRHEVLGRARAVASAAGGFLGIGSISDAEKEILAEIEATLEE